MDLNRYRLNLTQNSLNVQIFAALVQLHNFFAYFNLCVFGPLKENPSNQAKND